MDDFYEFQKVVKAYANAYSAFEKIQQNMNFIPEKGDQKTGIIGEAYICEYLSRRGCKKLEFGSHSEKGWDIKCSKYRYQVKTVSEYSKTQVISPIHEGWDFLYLVHLNINFQPDKIYKIENPGNWNDNVKKGKRFPKNDGTKIVLNKKPCTLYDETTDFMKIMKST